jgi:hypothetical protein
MYGVLRPDALLLYTDMKGKMPMLIIPIHEESRAKTATVRQVATKMTAVL